MCCNDEKILPNILDEARTLLIAHEVLINSDIGNYRKALKNTENVPNDTEREVLEFTKGRFSTHFKDSPLVYSGKDSIILLVDFMKELLTVFIPSDGKSKQSMPDPITKGEEICDMLKGHHCHQCNIILDGILQEIRHRHIYNPYDCSDSTTDGGLFASLQTLLGNVRIMYLILRCSVQGKSINF
jgi:hypothetical protein